MTVQRAAILAVTALACAIPLVSVKAQAAPGISYVAKTGSDTNPGTITLPWRTMQHAANVVGAGAVVYVRAGVYNEQVRINVSGTAAAPITSLTASMLDPGSIRPALRMWV